MIRARLRAHTHARASLICTTPQTKNKRKKRPFSPSSATFSIVSFFRHCSSIIKSIRVRVVRVAGSDDPAPQLLARDEEGGGDLLVSRVAESSPRSPGVAAAVLTALALVSAAAVATTTGWGGWSSGALSQLGYGAPSVPLLLFNEQARMPATLKANILVDRAVTTPALEHVTEEGRNEISAAARDTSKNDFVSSSSSRSAEEPGAEAKLGFTSTDDTEDTTAEAQTARRSEVVAQVSQTADASGAEGAGPALAPCMGKQSEEQQQQPAEQPAAAEEDEQPPASEGDNPSVAVSEVPDVDENGQPTFAAPLSEADEEFRRKEYEADGRAEASQDARETAEAYILDPDLKAHPAEWSSELRPKVGMDDPHNDLLAVAMRDDPVDNRYLPPIYAGFDIYADGWLHQPTRDRGGKNAFKVCIDHGKGSWDTAYAPGLENLFRSGLCFSEVTEGPCDEADVVIFNQGVLLWGGGHRAPDGAVRLPPKSHPDQVYIYYAHEAAGTFGWDLKDANIMGQLDYVAYFDQTKSALWWPFGPTLRSMLQDFKFFARPRENRIPGVSWLAIDCLPLRTHILQEIAEHFPVFSIGTCMNNARAPAGLPGRGSGDAQFQNLMSSYMFYFAMENGGACPGYATEKVWLALTRGSVPIYFGTDDIYDQLPSPDAIVDLKRFKSPRQLADRLYAIATDPGAYWAAHSWRYQDPMTWSEGFRRLLRVMSTDIKFGVCHVLQKGVSEYPRAQVQSACDYDFNVMGRRVDSWPERQAVKPPTEHLRKSCDRAEAACWSFIDPAAFQGGGGAGGALGAARGKRKP